jgi:putative transposase
MRTRACIIRKDSKAGRYFSDICCKSKALRNTTNFYIRNTYTGIMKSPEERTDNEKEVLHNVVTGIKMYNEHKLVLFKKDIWKARLTGGLGGHTAVLKAFKRSEPVRYPSRENRMLTYEVLDAVFKFTKDPVYYSLPAQVNQNAMRKTFKAWKGYFSAQKDWKKHPGKYKAKPGIPGYIRTGEATAWFTNQTAKLTEKENGEGHVLSFIDTEVTVGCGRIPGKYIKTEVKPYHGEYRLLVTYDDKAGSPEVPKHPERILGIDPGVNNFLAIANNYGETPYLIKGGAIKSWNQWYNRKRSALMKQLTKGKDSRHSIKDSHRLDALSRKRDERMRDFFCKCAHFICRRAQKDKVEVIVCGHNDGVKDGVGFKKKDNQNFVGIPERMFLKILEHVGAQYGIPVVIREESYTSQASVIGLDDIPTYGEEDGKTYDFSGKRIRRGLYRTKDGTILNADINGAANTIRKEYP